MIDLTRVGWGCASCSTRYALKLVRCPRCHGREFTRDPVAPNPTVAERPRKRTKLEPIEM